MIFLYYILSFVILYILLRSLLIWKRNEYARKVELIESRMKLEAIARKFENELLSRRVTLGDDAHDVLFRIINAARYRDTFFSPWHVLKQILFKKYRDRVAKKIQDMNKMIRNMPEELQKQADEFFKALFYVFIARHRIIFKLMICYYILTNFRMIVSACRESRAVEPDLKGDIKDMQVANVCC